MYHSREINDLRADVAANCRIWKRLCEEAGLNVLVTETVRDEEYQIYCFERGYSQSKRPAFHAQGIGLAFDFCKNVKGHEYDDLEFFRQAGELGEKIGFEWGGRWTSFPDKPHLQWSDGGKYKSSDIWANRLPRDMPLYQEEGDKETAQEHTTASRILQLAAAELGVKEEPVGSNKVKYNTDYYGSAVSGKDYKWCVTFLWWLFKQANASNLFYAGGKTASSTTLFHYYQDQGQAVELEDVQPGDLVFFNFDNSTGMSHTAICEGTEVRKENGVDVTYVKTIDGNTGDTTITEGDRDVTVTGYAVMRRSRKLFDAYVKGVARPAYAKEEQEMTAEQFRAMYNQLNPLYTSIDQVPEYWKDDVEELISSGAIMGDNVSPLHIRFEGLQAAVIAKRYHTARARNKYLDWDPDDQSTHLSNAGAAIRKYLAGDHSGGDYVAEHEKGLRFVTESLKVGEDGQTPLSRQLVNSYGQSLYWQKDVSGAELREGVPYIDGERVYTTVEATDWPVMVYQYDLQDKMGLSFQQDEATQDEVPVVTLGAGIGVGKRGKGFLYKGPEGLYLDYYSRDGEQLRRITIGDKGIALTPYGLGQLDVFPNGFSAVYSGEKVAYKWELNADGTIRQLVGEDGTTIPVTWHEEEK